MSGSAGYLLDTNVISETRRLRPSDRVMSFLATADSAALFLSVLTLGELRRGVEGKRVTDAAVADRLGLWVDTIETVYADRILVVDAAVARVWGVLSAARSLPAIDTLLAATAMVHDLTLVTRNGRDVEATGVAVLDPWVSG